jgi:hypothetical protein
MSDHPTSLWVAYSTPAGDGYIPNKCALSPGVIVLRELSARNAPKLFPLPRSIIVDLLHAEQLLATQRPRSCSEQNRFSRSLLRVSPASSAPCGVAEFFSSNALDVWAMSSGGGSGLRPA